MVKFKYVQYFKYDITYFTFDINYTYVEQKSQTAVVLSDKYTLTINYKYD